MVSLFYLDRFVSLFFCTWMLMPRCFLLDWVHILGLNWSICISVFWFLNMPFEMWFLPWILLYIWNLWTRITIFYYYMLNIACLRWYLSIDIRPCHRTNPETRWASRNVASVLSIECTNKNGFYEHDWFEYKLCMTWSWIWTNMNCMFFFEIELWFIVFG